MLKWVVGTRDGSRTPCPSETDSIFIPRDAKLPNGNSNPERVAGSPDRSSLITCRDSGLQCNTFSDSSSSSNSACVRFSECYSSTRSYSATEAQNNPDSSSCSPSIPSPAWKLFNTSHSSPDADSVIESKYNSNGYSCERRNLLEQQIDKEIRLRNGAEKLLAAACNEKLKAGICKEMKVINSNLLILKEELLNLSHISAKDSIKTCSFDTATPCITIGLKETRRVNFHSSFRDILSDHYYVNPKDYEDEVTTLSEMREACCESRSPQSSVDFLFSYYNQLYFVDRRFFPEDGKGPVEFTWYDSLTGIPYEQSTVGFEKGNILFNIAALYSQQAALEMVDDADRLQSSRDLFCRSAGTLKYLAETFLNAPSVDMQPQTIAMFQRLMLAQSQECEVRRILIQDSEIQECHLLRTLKMAGGDIPRFIELSRETAQVMSMYDETLSLMNEPQVISSVSTFWLSLVKCKRQCFSALSHWFTALALTSQGRGDENPAKHFLDVHESVTVKQKTTYSDQLIHDSEGRKTLARAHLRQAILANEESLGIVNQFRRLQHMRPSLKRLHDRSMKMFSHLEDEDNFSEILLAPSVCPKTKKYVEVLEPDFSQYKIDDLFRRLGCLAIFSRRHSWTEPRTISMSRTNVKTGFGFSVRGDSPVIVATIDADSLAEAAGMLVGDFIVAVGAEDVKWLKHENVVNMIRTHGDSLKLTLVTPTDKNYIDPAIPPLLPIKTCPSPDLFITRLPSPSPQLQTSRSSTLQREAETVVYISDYKIRERPMSSFSWKLRKRRSQSKDKIIDTSLTINNNACSQSFS